MHHHRAKHWIVVKGTARVTKDHEVILLTENQSTYIPLGVTHRSSKCFAEYRKSDWIQHCESLFEFKQIRTMILAVTKSEVSAIAMDNDSLFEKGGAGRPIYLLDWFLVTKFSRVGNKAVMMICAGTMINVTIFIDNLREMLLAFLG